MGCRSLLHALEICLTRTGYSRAGILCRQMSRRFVNYYLRFNYFVQNRGAPTIGSCGAVLVYAPA